MDKISVCVLFGGKSSEYEVSLSSAYAVLEAIDNEKYIVYKIGVSRDLEMYLFEGENEQILNDTWLEKAKNKPICVDFCKKSLVCEGEKIKPTLAFPVMHGEYGEDGRIQALFELLDIKIVGASSAGASLCMDKLLCKSVAMRELIPVVPYVALSQREAKKITEAELTELFRDLGQDVFVKPTKCGSSVGITRVRSEKALREAIKTALECSDTVLIEKSISGKECEVALTEIDGEVVASEVGEISYKADFYDYKTKYASSKVKYKIPAKIPKECRDLCQKYAKELFCALGARSLCRADFFVTDKAEVYFNEVNSIPGFTRGSMYPMLLERQGYKMSELVDLLIKQALAF